MVLLNFLSPKRIKVKLKTNIESALMYLVKKMVWFIQFMYQMKHLKTVWIYC